MDSELSTESNWNKHTEISQKVFIEFQTSITFLVKSVECKCFLKNNFPRKTIRWLCKIFL
jgi:hypothetical protein